VSKIKLGDLKNVENTILKVINAELPIKIAFQINLIVDDLDDKLTKLEKFRIGLVKKYGEEDKLGNLQVLPANMPAFSQELKELMDSDVDFKPVKIPLEVFDTAGIKVTVKELNALIKAGFIDQIE
jgi:hypothetical protein